MHAAPEPHERRVSAPRQLRVLRSILATSLACVLVAAIWWCRDPTIETGRIPKSPIVVPDIAPATVAARVDRTEQPGLPGARLNVEDPAANPSARSWGDPCDVEVRRNEAPVRAAHVRLVPLLPRDERESVEGITEADGMTRLFGLPGTDYGLEVTSGAASVRIAFIRLPTSIRIDLPTHQVTVRVLNSDGTRVDGFVVAISQGRRQHQARDDGSGSAVVAIDPGVAGRGGVTADDGRSAYFDVPAASENDQITIRVADPCALVGRVVSGDGSPVGCRIEVANGQTVTTGADGRFTLIVASGSFTGLWLRGDSVLDSPYTVDWDEVRTRFGLIPATVNLGDLVATISVVQRVRVVDPEGLPIEGAVVTCRVVHENETASAPDGIACAVRTRVTDVSGRTSARDGRATISLASGKPAEVTATADARADAVVEIPASGFQLAEEITIVLSAEASLHLDCGGDPAMWSDSTALLEPNDVDKSTRRQKSRFWLSPDSRGGFEGRRLPVGRCKLTVAGSRHVTIAKELELHAGLNTADAHRTRGQAITGRVLSRDGTPASKVSVALTDSDSTDSWQVPTDEHGEFRFEVGGPHVREFQLFAWVGDDRGVAQSSILRVSGAGSYEIRLPEPR